MKFINKTLSAITSATDAISVFFLCICTLTAFFNTVMRYVFLMPLRFSEELCVISLICLVFLSLPQLERGNEHLSMTALYNTFSPKLKTAMGIFRSILTIGVLTLLCNAGVVVVRRNFSLNNKTQVLDWPYGLIYLVIPIAFALIILIRLANITIKNNNKSEIEEKGGAEKC